MNAAFRAGLMQPPRSAQAHRTALTMKAPLAKDALIISALDYENLMPPRVLAAPRALAFPLGSQRHGLVRRGP
jgi:hypothetical protein